MTKRVFEFGATRRAEIVSSEPGLLIAEDEHGEAHLLLLTVNALQPLPAPEFAEGDRGTLTFTAGGPMGGFWKFTKDGR